MVRYWMVSSRRHEEYFIRIRDVGRGRGGRIPLTDHGMVGETVSQGVRESCKPGSPMFE